MTVGIDVTGALAPGTGIGRYTQALYRALSDVDDLALRPFCNARPASPSLDPADVVANPQWPARLIQASWRQFRWPPVERYTGPLSVFHTSDWSHPPLRSAARVTTVHDLGPILHPEWYAPDITEHHAQHNTSTREQSDAVIAISEYTRTTFLEQYSVPPEQVVVVPNGVDRLFAPASPEAVAETRQRYGLSDPFVLYVGTRERRKNLTGLIDIFARVAEAEPDVKLALVGARPWAEGRHVHGAASWSGDQVEERIQSLGLADRVEVLGAVPLKDLIALYTGAESFLFPTLFEGFGLPVLEAMACGCPVVASSRTAVPEVVGEAGLLADPADADGFARATLSLLADTALRADLVELGHARAAEFTWERTAEETAAVYRGLSGSGQAAPG